MEQLMNLSELNMVSEIELVYKNKVKPSERPFGKICEAMLSIIIDDNLLLAG